MSKQNDNRVVIGFCPHGQFPGTHLNYPPVIDEVELEAILSDVRDVFPTAKRIIRVPRKEVPRYSALLRKISAVCFLLLFALGVNAQSAVLNMRIDTNPLSYVNMTIDQHGVLIYDFINDIPVYYTIVDGQYGDPVLEAVSKYEEHVTIHFFINTMRVVIVDANSKETLLFRIVE